MKKTPKQIYYEWRYFCHACTNAAFYGVKPHAFKGQRQCSQCGALIIYEPDKWLPNV